MDNATLAYYEFLFDDLVTNFPYMLAEMESMRRVTVIKSNAIIEDIIRPR